MTKVGATASMSPGHQLRRVDSTAARSIAMFIRCRYGPADGAWMNRTISVFGYWIRNSRVVFAGKFAEIRRDVERLATVTEDNVLRFVGFRWLATCGWYDTFGED